ncbi:MAG: SRPBCC family protein [Thermomicrobiales bacterium]|nr:SRPBCC family protein [Thermomicrobiales bacterium]
MTESTKLKAEATIAASPDKVWSYYNQSEHITRWNSASDDWHTPSSENDLRVGGRFKHRMEARDGSEGFDFSGVYTEVSKPKRLAYTMDDGRQAEVDIEDLGGSSKVTVLFDPENEYPREFQQEGWQAILDAFKAYAEAN